MCSPAITIIALGALLGLSGCAVSPQPEPVEVMARLTTSLSELDSVHFDTSLRLSGQLASNIVAGLTDASFKFSGDLSEITSTAPKLQTRADISAQADTGAVGVSGNLVTIENSTFFQLTNFILPSLLPIQLTADQQWYKFDNRNSGLTPTRPSGADLTQLTESQTLLIKELIAGSRILEVIETFPIALVGSERAYHYRVRINPEELAALLADIESVIDQPIEQDQIQTWANYTPDIFVSTRTNQLVELRLADIYLRDNLPVAFDLRLTLSRHNTPVAIEPPTAARALPSEQLLNLPIFGGL